MAAPSGTRLRKKLSRVELVARYRVLRRRLEAFFIRAARHDRAALGAAAATEGELFTAWLPGIREWVHDLFLPATLQGLDQPELGAILTELIDLLGSTQLAEQLPLPPGHDELRDTALLGGPPVIETWALATRNVVDRIDTEGGGNDDYAPALARWIVRLPLNRVRYRVAIQRAGLHFQRTDALRAYRALQRHREWLQEWLDERQTRFDARALGQAYQALLAARRDPRDARFLPILYNANHERLTAIEQRAEFYLWAYELFADLGHEVRWPLAAHIVAAGAGEIANTPAEPEVAPVGARITDRLQAFMRIGNQVIFDDVLTKLSRLLKHGFLRGPLTDREAVNWDARTLAEEQLLIQPLYVTARPDSFADEQTIRDLYGIATKAYVPDMFSEIDEGRYHRAGVIPPFQGSLEEFRTPRARWEYGTLLGDRFSTLAVESPHALFPLTDVAPQYRDGSRLRQLNVRPYLHFLDALLDDSSPDATQVVAVLNQLSRRELDELRTDARRLAQLRALDDPTVNEFLSQHELN